MSVSDPRDTDLVALGHPGFEEYAGLESFENPGVARVELTSDELTAVCPVTGQPDLYVATIEYAPRNRCLESKSLKLYLSRFRNEGVFCEALAVQIRDDVARALALAAEDVTVTLEQKARGGISITATA
jgi:7-cyano-7-deazaguanine reductase